MTNQGSTVVIQPANPQVVYVPEYNPELVYGYPVPLWPGFYPWWGISRPFISFGIGFNIFPFFHFGWGWHAWGWHWGHGGGLFYHGGRYVFHSHAFYDRNAYFHGNYRGAAPFARGDRSLRGYARGRGAPLSVRTTRRLALFAPLRRGPRLAPPLRRAPTPSGLAPARLVALLAVATHGAFLHAADRAWVRARAAVGRVAAVLAAHVEAGHVGAVGT